jgi:RND family efflux transporter MFP subunit
MTRAWVFMAMAIAALGGAGCGPSNAFVPPPPPQVTVAKPVERDVAEALEFSGWTEATEAVELRSRVNGYLSQVLFSDGAMVKKNQLLMVIEPEPYEVALAAAKAQKEKAEATLALEQSEYDRTLAAKAAMTQADVDVAAAELATAKADVAAAAAAVRQAQLNLNYTEIRAPIAGRIGKHLVDVGNLVQAEQTVLARVEAFDPIYAYFSVSESDLLRYVELTVESGGRVDDEALRKDPPKLFLGLANEADFPREGHVDFAERSIDRQTGTAMQRGVFDNPGWKLIPGLFVRIKAPMGAPRPRLLVDQRAVGADQRGDYLYVVNQDNKVERRSVKLGVVSADLRVVEEGIGPDDLVIVNGLQRAREGMVVVPQMEGAAPAAPPAGATASAPPTAASKRE